MPGAGGVAANAADAGFIALVYHGVVAGFV
jgi:hypothetical protein